MTNFNCILYICEASGKYFLSFSIVVIEISKLGVNDRINLSLS